MSSEFRVDAARYRESPLEFPRSEGSAFGSIINKVTVFVIALFVSIFSFSVLSPPVSLGFSTIVLLSYLAYALPNTPYVTPVHAAPVYVRPPWHSYIPIFSSFWRGAPPTLERSVSAYHAPAGTGDATYVRRRSSAPPISPNVHSPVYSRSPVLGSPLERTPRVSGGGGGSGHAPGSRVSHGSPLRRTASPSLIPRFFGGGHAPVDH